METASVRTIVNWPLIRTFVAVDIKERGVVERVSNLQRRILDTGADVKLVEPNNLHITLRFLGEIPEPRVRAVIEELKKVRYRKFSMRLLGVGAFPDVRRPRVLWVGVKEGAEDLAELHRIVEGLIGRYATSREEGEFTPHLTIARLRSQRGVEKLATLLREYESYEFGVVKVEDFRVKKSTLTPRGPIYEDLYVIGLE